MLAGFFTSAMSFMRPLHFGHSRTSTANVRARSSAHGRYVDPARFCILRLGRRCLCRCSLHAGRDPRPPCARRSQHAGVLHCVEPRWRHTRRQATEERERVHVDRDGPVGVGALESDAHEAVWPHLEPFLRERGTEQLPGLQNSVLSKAFTGELIAQDPNDESAEAMLARSRTSSSSSTVGSRSKKSAREPTA